MSKELIAVSIDDNEQNLMVLEIFAEQIGLTVKSFTNPQKALEFLSNNKVDIIFVDYMMPKLNGIELIKKYREFNKTTPIMMITAAGKEIEEEALKAGATKILYKPLDLDEFITQTKELLKDKI